MHRSHGNHQRPWRTPLGGAGKSVAGLLAMSAIIVGAGALVQGYLDVGALRTLIEGLGPLAPAMFIGVAVLKNVLFLPILPIVGIIALGALIFGDIHGALYAWLGMSGGSCGAFLAARYGVGTFAARFKAGNWLQLDEVVSSHGFLSALGLRLVLFSNTALNYLSGLTSMTFRDYALGTLLGLIPRTFIVASVVNSLQEPDIWQALLTYPDLLWLPLLIVSWAGGIGLLAFVAKDWAKLLRQAGGRAGAFQAMSSLISGKFQSK